MAYQDQFSEPEVPAPTISTSPSGMSTGLSSQAMLKAIIQGRCHGLAKGKRPKNAEALACRFEPSTRSWPACI